MSVSSYGQAHLVKDINPNYVYAYNIQVNFRTEFQNAFYFIASSSFGRELFKTNGTLESTTKLDLLGNNANIHNIKVYNDELIIAGETANGIELWKWDGNSEQAVLLKDLSPGSGSSEPGNFQIVDGTLFFTANFNGFSYELWKTDGTSNGTELVKIIPSLSGTELTGWYLATDDLLIFMVQSSSSTRTMWRSDGTSAGTYELQDNLGNPIIETTDPLLKNNLVYFGSVDSNGNILPWVTNGFSSGTQQLSTHQLLSMTTSEDEVFFLLNDPVDGKGFWKTDATLTGINFVMDLFSTVETTTYVGNISVKHDTIRYEYSEQFQPYIACLYDINTQTIDTIDNCILSSVFFETENATFIAGISTLVSHGLELGYIQNGVYSELADIYPGSDMSMDKFLGRVGDIVYFMANDGINGNQLWQVNVSSLSVTRVSEIGKVASDGDVENIIQFDNRLFFSANDGTHGQEPWVSDGTEIGTTLIKDITPGTGGTYIRDFFTLNNELYFFTAQQPVEAIYKTDGTEAGTVFITNIEYSGSGSFAILNNELYFVRGGDFGNELWKTDGTFAGTVLALEAFPGSSGSFIIKPYTVNGTLFFQAYDASTSTRKWFKSDGTQAGTELANPDDTDPLYSTVASMVQIYDDNLISYGVNGNVITLYSLNTSNSNADVLAAFNDYEGITELQIIDDVAYFILAKPYTYRELWKIDLITNTPTLLLYNNNGVGGLSVLNDTLFVSYFDGVPKLLAITNASNDASDIINLLYDVDSPSVFDGELYFHGYYTPFKQVPILLTNHTLYPLYSPSENVSAVGDKLGIGNKLFFKAKTASTGFELWVYEKDMDTLPRTIIDTTVCNSYWCDINNTEYEQSNCYFDILQNTMNQDSVKLIINLTVNHPIPAPIASAPYIFPTSPDYCSGMLYLDAGTADLHAMIDSFYTTPQSNEVIVSGGLCHGIHSISVADSCGYIYQSYFVIPYPDETIYNISGGDALDSIGFVTENCAILYDQIDTAYISSISVSDTIATVVWTLTDGLGNDYFETATYNLLNGTGNYIFQIGLYCPSKSVESVFAVTQDALSEAGVSTFSHKLVSIYPNPTNNLVSISFDGNQAEVIIYDAQGKLIQGRSSVQSGEQISLSNVQTGVYFFEIITNEGKAVKRVVKN